MPVITESTEPSAKLSVKVTRESLLPRADILLISTERNIIEKIGSLVFDVNREWDQSLMCL